MHKKVIAIILSLMITSTLFAQESSENTRGLTIGTDILPLIFGFPNGFVGLLHNEGKNEINVAAFYFKHDDDDENISFLGLYPAYRFYPKGKGKGIFFEGGVGLGFINWDYGQEKVSSITFWPTVNLGYRWSWNFGLSLAPFIGGNYGIGKVEASDGTVKTFKEDDGSESEITGSLNPSIGIEIGYMF